jgi:hypothetical protein
MTYRYLYKYASTRVAFSVVSSRRGASRRRRRRGREVSSGDGSYGRSYVCSVLEFEVVDAPRDERLTASIKPSRSVT